MSGLEALAVSWEEVDLAAGTAQIEYTLIWIKGVGLVRKSTKSKAGERTLRLPAFALSMLRRRKLKAGGRGPVFPDSEGGWRDPSNTSPGRLATLSRHSAPGAPGFSYVLWAKRSGRSRTR
jgi:hypothetical protein